MKFLLSGCDQRCRPSKVHFEVGLAISSITKFAALSNSLGTTTCEWPCGRVHCSVDDASVRRKWSVEREAPTLIVHLSGVLVELETRITSEARTRVLPAPGDFWLIPSGAKYSAEAVGGPIRYCEVELNGGLGVNLPPLQGVYDSFIASSVEQLTLLAGSENHDDLHQIAGEAYLNGIFHHLVLKYVAGVLPHQDSGSFGGLSRRNVEDYIESHLAHSLSVLKLVELTGLSVHRLLEEFRKEFGQTPGQYILAKRVQRARNMLAAGNESIGRIAVDAGFSSQSHLGTVFRQKVGMTPSEYRDHMRRN